MTMRLDELLKTAVFDLRKAGIPTPDLDARLLLEHVLQKERTFILLHPDHSLTALEHALYTAHVRRRCAREPIAKILQTKEFWSLSFKTTHDTLDPRPDSETLIEAVLASFQDKEASYKILDLGTGTGCLLLALLSEYKNATGTGIDLSKKALDVAQHNADSLDLENRTTFLRSHWCKKLRGQFDIIISNPPYIPPSDATTLELELGFDPKEALYGASQDGLEAYRILSRQLKKHLAPQGKVFLEFGKDQHDDVKKIMNAAGFTLHSFHKDLSQISRCGVFHES